MADFYYDLAALLFENPDFRRAAIAHLNDVEIQERAEALLERLSDLEEVADDIVDQLDDEEGDEFVAYCDDPSCPTCGIADEDVSDDEVIEAEEELWTSSSDVWSL